MTDYIIFNKDIYKDDNNDKNKYIIKSELLTYIKALEKRIKKLETYILAESIQELNNSCDVIKNTNICDSPKYKINEIKSKFKSIFFKNNKRKTK